MIVTIGGRSTAIDAGFFTTFAVVMVFVIIADRLLYRRWLWETRR